jgi:lipopolysaccharide transport system ATP-binding protein
MTDIAIKIEGLGKRYRYGGVAPVTDSLRADLAEWARALIRRRQPRANSRELKPSALNPRPATAPHHPTLREVREKHLAEDPNYFWALRDINLEVRQGEVLGIIGRNGAGKSTLLKILSRITAPTTGRVEYRGRVASLLEVGTGFHRELTGRENIFLNGSILGMRRSEIAARFDEIVAFAGLEKFIDTPVKFYSSGMYVRLAFAVAAHLDPEILLVDEVLAVGDAEFQKKCLGKMRDVTRQGRTVLFVSHNMAAIKSLCSHAVLLDQGRLACTGQPDEVVDRYLRADSAMTRTGVIPDEAPRWGTAEAKIRSVTLTDVSGRAVSQLYLGQPFRVRVEVEAFKEIAEAVLELGVAAADGTRVTNSFSTDDGNPHLHLTPGRHCVEVELHLTLWPRQYTFAAAIHHRNGTTVDFLERTLDFTVLNVAQSGTDHHPFPGNVRGYVRPEARWMLPAAQTAHSQPIVSGAET